MRAKNVDKVDTFGKSDPYLIVSFLGTNANNNNKTLTRTSSGVYDYSKNKRGNSNKNLRQSLALDKLPSTVLYQTETIDNNLSPGNYSRTRLY